MSDSELGKIMYDKALAFINKRFPTDWGGCAVLYTEDEQFLISVALESFNAAACLCMETGAMCEAQKYNLRVTHSLCISRANEKEAPKILTACGICRERLRYWGENVKVAVSNPDNKIIFRTLKELDAYYWGNVFEEREEYEPLRLVSPSMEYAEDIVQLRKELLEAEEMDGSDAFAGCGSLRNCDTAEKWLKALADREREETCPAGGVTSNTYLAVRISDNRVVGVIDLRHHINHPILGLWGGHMGYIVRPEERGKGYAKEMLKLNLQKCRERGMEKVMITCSPENLASERTILANGGVFEKEVLVDGEYIKRYWVTL